MALPFRSYWCKAHEETPCRWALVSLDYESSDTCEPCLTSKMTKTPFSRTMERTTDLLEIIHTDVCDPMSVDARGGYRYFLTFTYDLSDMRIST